MSMIEDHKDLIKRDKTDEKCNFGARMIKRHDMIVVDGLSKIIEVEAEVEPSADKDILTVVLKKDS